MYYKKDGNLPNKITGFCCCLILRQGCAYCRYRAHVYYRGMLSNWNKVERHACRPTLIGGGEQLGILYGACAKFSAQSLGEGVKFNMAAYE